MWQLLSVNREIPKPLCQPVQHQNHYDDFSVPIRSNFLEAVSGRDPLPANSTSTARAEGDRLKAVVLVWTD
jgi:hypothetical protein